MDTLSADLLARLAGWDLTAQAQAVSSTIAYARMAGGRMRYPATDRELNIAGLIVAVRANPEGAATYRFPSGAVAHLEADRGAELSYLVEGQVLPDDLPDDVGPFVVRMPPHLQQEREAALLPLWRAEQRAHEQAREEREHKRHDTERSAADE